MQRKREPVAPQAPTPDETETWSARRRAALAKTVGDLEIPDPRFPPRVVRRAFARILDSFFERGIRTAGMYYAAEHFHSERVPYEPSGWFYLRRAIRRRDVRPGDVFVDFGSGKGRVVYQAARYPFSQVVGVEISEPLNDIARANIERNRQKLACQNIEFVTTDAAEFQVPDDMTVAYFFYPFSGETLRRVLGNIVRSLDRNPRRLRLIYACPGLEGYIRDTGRFELIRTSKGGLTRHLSRTISIYESR